MSGSRPPSIPPWWLALDLAASGLLAAGLVVLLAPGAVAAWVPFTPSAALGTTLAVLGGAGLLAGAVALLRLLRHPRPH